MNERLYGDRFTWTIDHHVNGVVMTLEDHKEKRSKNFRMSGQFAAEALHSHINSLTDELCEGFWPRERTKKVKKQTEEVK